MSSPVSTWPRTRTIASPIAISMRPRITVSAGGDGGVAGAGDDVADAITTGAKAGSGPGDPRGFNLPLLGRGHRHGSGAASPAGAVPTASRACRRQPNNCCGLSPCRRATSDTLAPGFRLSTTMRALSSADHCRRRPVPVISSIRRTVVTPPSALSAGLLSSVCSNRSLIARHQATTRARPKRGVGVPLTLKRQAQHYRNKENTRRQAESGLSPLTQPGADDSE